MVMSLHTLGRVDYLFGSDYTSVHSQLKDKLDCARVLVIGGAGTIGQAVVRELFKFEPAALHVIDISENNLVELVRSIRSKFGPNKTDFQTFVIDVNEQIFDTFLERHVGYDFVFNLSALKHVRSERDPFTIIRVMQVNIMNSLKLHAYCQEAKSKNYFCVSTDKAANPVNVMGATKRLMEKCLFDTNDGGKVTMARFANVAFSDGSLLHGFSQRYLRNEPITAPSDIRRYFMTDTEAGILCVISGILGDKNEIFFPKLSQELHLTYFTDIANRFLVEKGYMPFQCETEEEARSKAEYLILNGKWPVYYFPSDTTGEKPFEEFYTKRERPILDKFEEIGVIRNTESLDLNTKTEFVEDFAALKSSKSVEKKQLIDLLKKFLPEFDYIDKEKNLHERM